MTDIPTREQVETAVRLYTDRVFVVLECSPELQTLVSVAKGWLQRYWCHAHKDGECVWDECPQLRDGEPSWSGRHCPLEVTE